MSVVLRTVPITTDADGDDVSTVLLKGRLLKISIDTGDLSTPDITITDEPSGTEILAVTGLAADASYYPSVVMQDDAGADVAGFAAPVIFGRIQITTAGGGATKSGSVQLAIER